MTVVIPVRNDAASLAICLGLLAGQTRPPDEVVVVDNDSSDDSAAVARRHGARVVREATVGIPAAAAAGYDAARGEIVLRCDADSRPGPRWVERLAARLAADPALDAVTGMGVFYDLPRGVRLVTTAAYLGAYYLLAHLAMGHTALWGSNMALRRSSWLAVREGVERADQEVHDDMDLAFALGPGRRIALTTASVGVSARSLRGRVQRRRRLRRALRTLERNWAVLPPWLRWQARWQRR